MNFQQKIDHKFIDNITHGERVKEIPRMVELLAVISHLLVDLNLKMTDFIHKADRLQSEVNKRP